MIATISAITLVGGVLPAVGKNSEQKVQTSSSTIINLVELPGVLEQRDADDADECRALNRSYIQVDAELSGNFTTGQVFTVGDGIVGVLIVVAETNAAGRATVIDFAANQRVSAIAVRASEALASVVFEEPVRNRSSVRGPDGEPIDTISFCYVVDVPTAAAPSTKGPAAVPNRTSAALTLDPGDEQTADARVAELEATTTAALAGFATSEARAGEIGATATAAAGF